MLLYFCLALLLCSNKSLYSIHTQQKILITFPQKEIKSNLLGFLERHLVEMRTYVTKNFEANAMYDKEKLDV